MLETSNSLRPSGLMPFRAVLDNGVVFLGKQTRMTPAVAIQLAMRAGSMCDPSDAVGATWLLSRVIDRGTVRRSVLEIAEELDNRGITLTITVNRHVFSLSCTCLTDDFAPVLSLLAEVLTEPSVPEDELVRCKREVVTSIRQDDDNPGVRASEALLARLYANGHPYGRRTKGTTEVVEQLTRDRLLRLHADHFAPSGLTAIVVGDVDMERSRDVVARTLGGWRRPIPADMPLHQALPPGHRQRLVLPMMNKAQAELAYGFTAIRRSDPAYEALRLANNVLGQYALGGRLGDSIRERQGMAYHVSSALDPGVVEGPLVIRAGVSPANVDRAVASIDEELTRLAADGITATELDESRRYLIGAMPRALETNASIASFLQLGEFFGLGLDYDSRMPGLLHALTLDDVNAAARRILDPSRAVVVIAGPYIER